MNLNPIKIWKAKGQILEGIKNNIFKQEHVEEIAQSRFAICNICPHLDTKGEKCAVPGTQPCCGDCGCKLSWKTRSFSSDCPKGFWKAILTQEEDYDVTDSIINGGNN
jgi:hypothetical protein